MQMTEATLARRTARRTAEQHRRRTDSVTRLRELVERDRHIPDAIWPELLAEAEARLEPTS